MSTTPDPAPAAIPWYESNILRGIVTGLVAQVLARLQSRFGMHLIPGLDTELVNWIMDAITAGAIAYTTRARVIQKVAPTLVLTKQKAEDINAAAQAESSPERLQ
jgi:hypothetical protein